MAEEQSKGIQQIEGCEVIYDMGSGLVIAKVPLDKVKEQDINARIMKNEMQDQLTANIKKRGQLESLPLFVLVDGKLEIISGHHRVKSARAAEMKEIIAIVDVSGLSRSKIAAKQLAHNAISGFDDDSTLREIVKMIDDVDDMIESFVGNGNSDPIAFFQNKMTEINEETGRTPNRLGLGVNVYNALKEHPAILERVKYGGSTPNPAKVNLNVLAQLFEIDRIVLDRTVQNKAGLGQNADMGYIGDPNSFLLAYATDTPSISFNERPCLHPYDCAGRQSGGKEVR